MVSMQAGEGMAVATSDSLRTSTGLPRLPLDLSKHKLAIGLYWSPIVLTSCVLPIVGYFALKYGTSLSVTIILSIFLSIMGGVSFVAFLIRAYALWRKDSDCRPLGVDSRWAFDYFFWNFIFTFCFLTALITSGITLGDLTIVSLPPSILVLWISLQMVGAEIMLVLRLKVPFQISSLRRGDAPRSGLFVIVEDVVAVDGKQGRAWRRAWNERYLASPVMRKFLSDMERLWALTALSVVAITWGMIFGVDDHEIGYAVGWALPFVWGAVMAAVTIFSAKRMLVKERSLDLRQKTTGDT